LEILKYLREENVFGAVALHAVAGFWGGAGSTQPTWWKPEANCQSFLSFVDTDEHVGRVLPRLREMAAHRLIVVKVS